MKPAAAPSLEQILDAAGQKGTGKWTGIAALDEGVPLTLIGEAVFARCLSAMKGRARGGGDSVTARQTPAFTGDRTGDGREAIHQMHSTPARSFPMPRAMP